MKVFLNMKKVVAFISTTTIVNITYDYFLEQFENLFAIVAYIYDVFPNKLSDLLLVGRVNCIVGNEQMGTLEISRFLATR